MNKYKKIATAVVATVMAATMATSLAACGKKDKRPEIPAGGIGEITKPELADELTPTVDANDRLSFEKDTKLTLDVGNNGGSWQDIAFQAHELAGSVKLPDGNTYSTGDLKPAWQALQKHLGLKFENGYENKSSNEQITALSDDQLKSKDLVTASLQVINENTDKFLNLRDYLYYMPNYADFLTYQPVTAWSLTGDQKTGAMYAAPYFDGNDDFENYVLAKKDWAKTLLDTTVTKATDTYAEQATAKGLSLGTESGIKNYMGTEKWEVDTTDPADNTKVVKLVVDYPAALEAAKSETTDLGKAVKNAAGKTYDGTSGNIVDLMNYVLKEKAGAVTGNQLVAILQAYIDVTYKTSSGDKFYATRSDIFNSASAGWDVDLYVAMMRCVVTSVKAFDAQTAAGDISLVYGIRARQGTTQRRVNLYGLAGELYGIRGMGSRYEYTYFDKDGKIHDARQDAESYDLIARMGEMAKEGLIYTGDAGSSGASSYYNASEPQAFSSYDYVQTQTQAAFANHKNHSKVASDYNYGPIVTPISKWDVDRDGSHTDIMRFTESWRSVKNTGFCIPIEAVRGNKNKLAAVLAFVDYLFSKDGQILMTYGEASSSATATDGWWKGDVVDEKVDKVANLVEGTDNLSYAPAQYEIKDSYKDQYFVYNGKVYKGFAYAGGVVPQITDANKKFYEGEEVNGVKQSVGDVKVSAVGSYTDYARKIIGTTLPIGNKNQGFEYQASAQCGIDGANNLTVCELNQTVKHVELTLMAEHDNNPWYLIVPTAMPFSTQDQNILKDATQTKISGKYFLNSSSTDQRLNAYLDLLFFGFDSSKNIAGVSDYGPLKANGNAYVAWINGEGMTARAAIQTEGWEALNALFHIV